MWCIAKGIASYESLVTPMLSHIWFKGVSIHSQFVHTHIIIVWLSLDPQILLSDSNYMVYMLKLADGTHIFTAQPIYRPTNLTTT